MNAPVKESAYEIWIWRFIYMTHISPPAPGKIDGIIKFDVQTGIKTL